MRIIFMGTPDFATPSLAALLEAGHEIIAVYCQPPRPAGRGKKLRPSPVQQAAEAAGLEVRHPTSLKGAQEQAEFAALGADIAVVAAYGLILPQAILDGPKYGCVNVHGSLLPRWRGAAPVQRAILAGDEQTGITIMQMEAGLDTGPMLMRKSVSIGDKNAGELTAQLADLGAGLMVEVLAQYDGLQAERQDETLATYAPKIDKAEAQIGWHQSAEAVVRQVRGFAPWPGAWFMLGDGEKQERVKLLMAEAAANHPENAVPGEVLDDALAIACGPNDEMRGAIRPLMVQRAGRPAMSVADFLRGRPVPPGEILRSSKTDQDTQA